MFDSYVFVCKEHFVYQKLSECIPESLITHETFAGNFNLFLSLHLFMIALLSCFVIKGPWFPLIIFHFRGACLSNTDLNISEKVEYMSLLYLSLHLESFLGLSPLKKLLH